MLPKMDVAIVMPEMLADRAYGERQHKKYTRTAVERGLAKHHTDTIPGHFEPHARQKYGYAPRTEKYQRYKRKKYGHNIDLVKTGQTKSYVTNSRQIRGSGRGTGQITAALVMRLSPHIKGSTGRFRRESSQADNIRRMIADITRIRDDEKQRLMAFVGEQYREMVTADFAVRRRRRNIKVG